jgi:hypothetical protein
MPVPYKPHTFQIDGVSFVGFAETMPIRPDDTPPQEALTLKAKWRVMVDTLTAAMVQDAPITAIQLGSLSIEAGPIYVREVHPNLSGLPTDHVEIIAYAYRNEA